MLDLYKKRMNKYGGSVSDALKSQSNTIMNHAFKNDTAYKIVIINEENVDARFYSITQHLINSDTTSYKLQFRPHIKYPLGTYVSIPNEEKDYEDWLLVDKNDDIMFPKYNLLKCNYVLRWITQGRIATCNSIVTDKNSGSGIASNEFMVTVDGQINVLLPSNQDVKTIQYGTRFLITYNEINPISYKVTKIEDAVKKGITRLTLLKDEVSIYDNKELMIADYYKTFPLENYVDGDYEYQLIGLDGIATNSNSTYKVLSMLNGEQIVTSNVVYTITDVNGDLSDIVTYTITDNEINIATHNTKGTIVLKANINQNIIEKVIKIKGLL